MFATILFLQSLPFLSAAALFWLGRFGNHDLKKAAVKRAAT
jgi:hypothetical protein